MRRELFFVISDINIVAMSSRKIRYYSETSEDADDPPPRPRESSVDGSDDQRQEYLQSDDGGDHEEVTYSNDYRRDLPSMQSPEHPNQSDASFSEDGGANRAARESSYNSDDDPVPSSFEIQKNVDYSAGTSAYHYGSTFQPKTRSLSSHSEDMDKPSSEAEQNTFVRYNTEESDYPSVPQKRSRFSSSFSDDTDDQQQVKPLGKRPWDKANTDNKSGFQSRSAPIAQRGLRFLSNSTSADSADTDQEDGEPPRKKSLPVSMRMMEKMGYKVGKGLGKLEQGIVDPIAESSQRGRRGLGLRLPELSTASLKYNPSMETISVKETKDWLEGPSLEPPTIDEMREWLVVDARKNTIDDESTFCDPIVLSNVLSSKSVFDRLDGKELLRARSRANPFELIRGGIFLNRAAMKMANMDAVFDFMFTVPRDRSGRKLLGPNDLLYFADVCAGPGGFSEYVLYKKNWKAKGIGFTLKGPCDFRLSDFFAAQSETFDAYYGVNDDGDVYNLANIDSLHHRVMSNTEGRGVHFMMADGGFSVEGQENIQEVLSKRLYLCQCLVALRIVREGGHFVVKLFDLFTSFSVGLIYLMYRCFDRITIHKPNTSRPANSERYLICQYKKSHCDDVIRHMTYVNKKLAETEKTDLDVSDIVPLPILTDPDSVFFNYIVNSNNSLGEKQVVQLLKIAAYCEDVTLQETKQHDLKRECFKMYQVPDKTRSAPPHLAPAKVANDAFGKPIEKLTPKNLNPRNCSELGDGVMDWLCCAVGSKIDDDVPQPTFFVGTGGSNVFRYEGREVWTAMPPGVEVELPRNTLIVGELTQEFEGGRFKQKKLNVLHIIDAAYLAGEDIRHLPMETRLEMCRMFAKALRGDSVKAKPLYPLIEVGKVMARLEKQEHKNGNPCLGLYVNPSSMWFMKPNGLLIISRTKHPWTRSWSKTLQRDYFFHTKQRASQEQMPPTAASDFHWSMSHMLVWWWDDGVKMRTDQQLRPDLNKLQPEHILKYINKKLPFHPDVINYGLSEDSHYNSVGYGR